MNIFSACKKLKIEYENLSKEKNNILDEIKLLDNKKSAILNDINSLSIQKDTLVQEISKLNLEKNDVHIKLLNKEHFFVQVELKYIDSLNGYEFEEYCANLLNKLKYKTKVTQASQDNGGDIIATKDDISYIIQCKHYSETVGNKAVQEVYTAKALYQCDKAIVLTNNNFTKQAIKEATLLDIDLWDRNKLIELLYSSYNFDINHLSKSESNNIENIIFEAAEYAIKEGLISTSSLQRYFKIGYQKAGSIIDMLEAIGVISGYDSFKPRKVLITAEEWQKMKNNLKE